MYFIDNEKVTESLVAQDDLHLKIDAKGASKKKSGNIGKKVTHVVVNATGDKNRNFGAARRKNNLVMVHLCSSSDSDTSNGNTDSYDTAKSDYESQSDSSDSTSDSSEVNYSFS